MRKGIVRMSTEFLIGGLKLPSQWELLSIHMDEGDRDAKAVISGPEFPEVTCGEEPKECRVIVHKCDEFTFEVEEIK